MVKSAVVAIVNYNGKILLGKKRKDSKKFLAGEWHMPGETVEDTETDEQALIRGVKEEAGLEIKIGRYIGFGISPTNKREVKWYECFADTDKIICGSDLDEIKWVDKNQVLANYSSRAKNLLPKQILDYFL